MRQFLKLWGHYCRETAEIAAVMVIVSVLVVVGMLAVHHTATVSVPAMVAILGPWWTAAFGLAGLLFGSFLAAGLVAGYKTLTRSNLKGLQCRPN